jgi:hypothetical protein
VAPDGRAKSAECATLFHPMSDHGLWVKISVMGIDPRFAQADDAIMPVIDGIPEIGDRLLHGITPAAQRDADLST